MMRFDSRRTGQLGLRAGRVVGWLVAALVIADLVGYAYLIWTAEEQQVRQSEKVLGQAMGQHIQVSRSQGGPTHELYLLNGSKVEYAQCDLTLVILCENGQRPQLTQYWSSWAPQEKKTIAVSAEWKIERVDLTGTMTLATSKEKGQLNSTFEWKPAKP